MLSATFTFVMAVLSAGYIIIKVVGSFSKKHFKKEMETFYIGNY